MVLYDDKKWLCRLIRTAFTIEDDSGVCEKVLKERPHLGTKQDADSSSVSSEESFDIRDGAELGHRRRSNTAIRLEKLDKQRKAQVATTNIRATDAVRNDIVFEKNSNFQDDCLKVADNAVDIAKLLESTPHPDSIPFASFAKYAASCHPSIPCKRMAIFISFLPMRIRSYPLKVAVTSSAKIVELIGLLLWMVSQSHPDIKLKTEREYNLQIGDDDGEFDTDFPPLDHEELIAKFSFSHLVLVPAESRSDLRNSSVSSSSVRKPDEFVFLLPNGGNLRMQFSYSERESTTLKDVITLLLTKSGWNKLHGYALDPSGYHFEKLGDVSKMYNDLSMTLKETKGTQFCLVRNGAKSVQAAATSESAANNQNTNEIPGGRSELYPVTVTGRFNRVRNALCVIWGRERMDLEFQTKTKSYPLSQISGVKLDATKNRVMVSISQISPMTVGSHYLTNPSHLQLSTSELRTANELYHHLSTIIESTRPQQMVTVAVLR